MRVSHAAQAWLRCGASHEGRVFTTRSRQMDRPRVPAPARTMGESRPPAYRGAVLELRPDIAARSAGGQHHTRESIGSRRAVILWGGVYMVETHATPRIDRRRAFRIARKRTRREGLQAKLCLTLLAA